MTLAQLRYFLAIVDSGLNITLAAERVNATQPGLSKQLKLLEDELGVSLFVRRGRSLDRLTAAGEEITERARIIIAEADNIRTFVANQRGEKAGALFIETTHIHAQYVLPPALSSLRCAFPDVDMELGFSADSDDAARRNPDADLSIFSTDGRLPAGDIAIPLYRWSPVALVPVGHPLAESGGATLPALARHPLITYDTSKTAPLSIARTFLDAGFSPRFAYTVRDAGVIKQAVRDGLGVGLLAEMAADPAQDRDLSVVSLAGLFPECVAWAVLRRDRVLRGYLVQLLSILSGLTPRQIQRIVNGEAPIADRQAILPWPERRQLLLGREPAGAVPPALRPADMMHPA